MEGLISVVLFAVFLWFVISISAKNHSSINKMNKVATRNVRKNARKIIMSLTSDDDEDERPTKRNHK